MYKLEPLSFAYDALEPYIDTKTVEIHYSKHHQSYVDKLNAATEKYPELQKKGVEELLKNLGRAPEDIRNQVRNFGGGHANHTFFWKILKKDGGLPQGEIKTAIEAEFGNFEQFEQKFSASATSLFGSGWTWLVLNKGKLEIINSANQDNPLSEGKTPLLVIDVWEHAYYLKFMNKRADFVAGFFNIINWQKVNELYIQAKKQK